MKRTKRHIFSAFGVSLRVTPRGEMRTFCRPTTVEAMAMNSKTASSPSMAAIGSIMSEVSMETLKKLALPQAGSVA